MKKSGIRKTFKLGTPCSNSLMAMANFSFRLEGDHNCSNENIFLTREEKVPRYFPLN